MKKLKQLFKKINFAYFAVYKFRTHVNSIKRKHGHLIVKNFGNYKITKYIQGKNNEMFVGKNTFIDNALIRIMGNNNKIIFDENVRVGPKCSFWMEGDNIEIRIGQNTTFTLACHINAQENDSRIIIGEDCMFSNNIIVRTSDSHPIIDLNTRKRINPPKNVVIGDHVWIAPQAIIMKGCVIGDGSIVGSRAVLTKEYPQNVLIVGSPGKIAKENISWTREPLF